MNSCKKPEDITPDDFERFPVWEAAIDLDEVDGTLHRPVKELPVHDLGLRVVGTKVTLANGIEMFAALHGIHLESEYKTRHLMSLSFFHMGGWIHLDRYHDYSLEKNGPEATARKLGLKVSDVFPVKYDVSNFCVGDPGAVAGFVESDPKDKLTRDEILDLITDK